MMGGLGNQLFQYASARALSLKLKVPVHLDIRWYEVNRSRTFQLNSFSIKASIASGGSLLRCPSPSDVFARRATRFIGRQTSPSRWPVVVQEAKGHRLADLRKPTGCGYYLVGYWQDPETFGPYWSEMAIDFEPVEALSHEAESLASGLKQPSSISVHVRRGDYVGDPRMSAIHPAQEAAFYERAMDEMRENKPDARFFVFSDDPEWAANHLAGDFVEIVDASDGRTPVDDLMLMSLCSAHIISNSTFSWWAAWLGRGRDGLVVAPRQWSNPGHHVSDPCLPHWIRI